MLPITPNMLLIGRSSDVSPPMVYSADDKFCRRLAYVDQVEQDWWDRWYKQVLPTLFQYKKWKRKQDNLQVDDIVMMQYPGHFKDDYTLARISEVHPDPEGLVRVVTVQFRKKNPKESKTVCNSRSLITEKVAIHRLHRLDLADEAHEPDGVQGGQGEGPGGVQAREHADEVVDQHAVQGGQGGVQGHEHAGEVVDQHAVEGGQGEEQGHDQDQGQHVENMKVIKK